MDSTLSKLKNTNVIEIIMFGLLFIFINILLKNSIEINNTYLMLNLIFIVIFLLNSIIITKTLNYSKENNFKIFIFLLSFSTLIEIFYFFNVTANYPKINISPILFTLLMFIQKYTILAGYIFYSLSICGYVKNIAKVFTFSIFSIIILTIGSMYLLTHMDYLILHFKLNALSALIPLGLFILLKLNKKMINTIEESSFIKTLIIDFSTHALYIIFIIVHFNSFATLFSPKVYKYILFLKIMYAYYINRLIIYKTITKPKNKLQILQKNLEFQQINIELQNTILIKENIKFKKLTSIFNEQEEALNNFFDTTTDGMLVINENFEIIYTNNSIKYIFNNNSEENRNIKLSNTIINHYLIEKNDFNENISNTIVYNKKNENTLSFKNGNFYKCIYTPLLFKQTKCCLCVFINKTSEKEAEKKITEEIKNKENLIENIKDGVAVFQDDKLIYSNSVCNTIFKNFDDINFLINTNFSNNERYEFTFSTLHSTLYVRATYSSFINKDKLNTIVLIEDITNKKIEEKLFNDRNVTFESIINLIPNGICLLDKNLTVFHFNEIFLSMLKYKTSENLIGLSLFNFLNVDNLEKQEIKKLLHDVLINKKSYILPKKNFTTQENTSLISDLNIIPFEFNNKVCILLLAKDLSLNNNESSIFKNEIAKNEDIDNNRMEFFSSMSHELKTPVNLISSSNQLLNSLYDNNINFDKGNNLKNHIELVKTNVYRFQKLIHNILDLTKMESGKYELIFEENDIVSVIEDIFINANNYAEKKNITMTFDTNMEEFSMIFDKFEIERIILNLLSNSIKFTNPFGNISLDLKIIPDNNIEIYFSDTGCGIPTEKHNHVFNAFSKAENIFSRNAEGSALGLPLVKHLVCMHNGNISFDSKENIGTLFKITIPINNKLSVNDSIKIFNDDIISRISVELSDIYYY